MTITTQELDTDTVRIVSELVDLQAKIADLTTRAEALKAELRSTLTAGDHTINGRPAIRIIPTRRFDVNAAARRLTEDERKECLTVAYDATAVKKHLTEIEIDELMVESGKPKVMAL